jgi:hypothetical protein
MRGLPIHSSSQNKVQDTILVHLIPTSCNGYSQRVGMDMFLQFKCESMFGIIFDLQRIQINKLTVQKQINISIISIFDKLKKENHSSKKHEVDVTTLNL